MIDVIEPAGVSSDESLLDPPSFNPVNSVSIAIKQDFPSSSSSPSNTF